MKKFSANLVLFVGIPVILFFGIWLIVIPIITPYPFTTFTKVSGIYDETITIKINWEPEDELQVGKPTKVSMELRDLPYRNFTLPLEDITIHFDERDLNYLHPDEQRTGDITYDKDFLTFTLDGNSNSVESDYIWIRFIVPTDIAVKFCDPNLKPECETIEKIIHPAPHDLAIQIRNNQIGIAVSLIIASFSLVIIWNNLRQKKDE